MKPVHISQHAIFQTDSLGFTSSYMSRLECLLCPLEMWTGPVPETTFPDAVVSGRQNTVSYQIDCYIQVHARFEDFMHS